MLYYYPNRPTLLSPDSEFVKKMSDDKDIDAEIKKNGARLSLWKSSRDALKHPSFQNFLFWNRTKEILKYTPTEELLDELLSLNLPDNTHIDAELMHFQTKNIKHFIYIYDLYIFNGRQMLEELQYRRESLHNIFRGKKFKHLEIAQTYKTDFYSLFKQVIVTEENEGLVMKNKKGKIVWNLNKSSDVDWQTKIRKPSKKYEF